MKKIATCLMMLLVIAIVGCSEESSKTKLSELTTGSPSDIVVKEWQPRVTIKGRSFNVQPNGDSALWFLADGIQTGDKYEFWFGDSKLDALVIDLGKGGSVSVPPKLIAKPGRFYLYIKSKTDNKKIPVGEFEVKSK